MMLVITGAIVGFIVPVLMFFVGAWVGAKRQRKKSVREALLSPRAMCAKHGVQACHCCERLACCDNLSPGKDLLRAAQGIVTALESSQTAAIPFAPLQEAVKKLEEMG